MRSRFFTLSLLACLSFAASAPAQTQAWTKFSSPEGRFTVLMPLEPKQEEESKETARGRVVMRFFTAGSQRGIFIVAYADYAIGGDARRELDANRNSFLEGMKATLISESDIKLKDNPGREIRATRDNLSIRSRIFLVGGRYYQIVAITPATLPGNLEADKFFASFELTAATTAGKK